jgi:lipopolysaccharide/colanic/teichoic acid biosynthesis glycosyltransferase
MPEDGLKRPAAGIAAAANRVARESPPEKPFPYLSGLSAQRLVELLGLRLAPAFAAAGIAYTRLDSVLEALLVLTAMVAISSLARRPRYPMHLMPVASWLIYLLVPPAGVLLATLVMAADGNSATEPQGPAELMPPILGAWLMTILGAWVAHSFRADRELPIAVIGSHEFAHGLQAELDAVGVRGYRVVGCIDPEESCATPNAAGVRCLGSLSLLRSTVLRHGIELLVLGPLSPAQDPAVGDGGASEGGVSRLDVFERVADACLDLPVSMIDSGQLYEEVFGHVPLGTTNAAWFQYLLHPRYRAGWPISKRLLDLSLGLVASLIALPVLVLSALAIKLQGGGPVLHRQRRIGERGREIVVIKLRTMTPHDDGGVPRWTASDDERVTTVGRLLRRLHIDELPQLWLVLKGQMSLVGPRPERPEIVTELESWFSYYDRRHLVKPGITGWAQVRCGYAGSHIGTAWKLCHDLYYLKRRSTVFDLLIMAETLARVGVPEPIKRPDERFIVAMRAGEQLPEPASPPA